MKTSQSTDQGKAGQHSAIGATVPAPWALRLRGVVLFLRDDHAPADRPFLSRFHTVAFVDYSSSDVGPYRELLFTGPVTRRADGTGPSVTDIWVTSEASARSGNANWGLTKSVARITRTQVAGREEAWSASDEDGALATMTHRPLGPALPAGKPRGLGRLLQASGGEAYATPVSVLGLVRPTRITSLTLDAARILDLERYRVTGALACSHMRMGFHAAERTPLR